MSTASHAFKRLCRLYRGVLQNMRSIEWVAERCSQSAGALATPRPVLDALEPRPPHLAR